MATNQAIDGRYLINVPVPAGVAVNDPVLVGTMAGVILALQPIPTPDSPTSGTIDLGEDCYNLTVIAVTSVSPVVTSAVKPGDRIYATGTLDATTNITYNLTLSKASGGALFGNALSAITAGVTDTSCIVRLGAN